MSEPADVELSLLSNPWALRSSRDQRSSSSLSKPRSRSSHARVATRNPMSHSDENDAASLNGHEREHIDHDVDISDDDSSSLASGTQESSQKRMREFCRKRFSWFGSNKLIVALTIVGIFIAFMSYFTSRKSQSIAQKSFDTDRWKDCHDRQEIFSERVCESYRNMSYDSIASRSASIYSAENLNLRSENSSLRSSAPSDQKFGVGNYPINKSGAAACLFIITFASIAVLQSRRLPRSFNVAMWSVIHLDHLGCSKGERVAIYISLLGMHLLFITLALFEDPTYRIGVVLACTVLVGLGMSSIIFWRKR